MAVSNEKTRVMVTFPKELLSRIDAYCERTGMNRSSYIGYVVATNLDTNERLVGAAADSLAGFLVQSQG